jgi:hypothetical protein
MLVFSNFSTFYIDAIGVIKSVGALTVVHERVTLKPLSIVRLLLFDSTGDVEVNLWNDMVRIVVKILRPMIIYIVFTNARFILRFVIQGSSFVGQKNDILAVKGFRLCIYHSEYLWI